MVVETLRKIIVNREFAQSLIETAIKRIKVRDFLNAMESNYDPSRLILNHFHAVIEKPEVKPLVQFALKLYWSDIEEYLTNVHKIYEILCLNPELKEVLEKPEARRYLNYAVASAYKRLYEWVWLNRNPYAGD